MDIHDLLRADAFPHNVERLELRETHTSWVVLTGTVAYKIKKPLQLEFIDSSTLERRRFLCSEELRLNRRLAPELYLDVVAITQVSGRLSVGGDGEAVEYAVRMRQFDSSRELLALLADDQVTLEEIVALADLLADFHAHAEVAASVRGDPNVAIVLDSVLGNAAQLCTHVAHVDPNASLTRLIGWTQDSAHTLEPLLRLREQFGFVRECHGDLHAGNVVRSGNRLVPFDCLEFDPQLRFIDTISDMAFLVMDLVSHNRPDLAFALLSRYLEISGDYQSVRLLPFYAIYRALVRAKVDAISAARVPHRAGEFIDRMSRRLQAASCWLDRRPPVLILMHGLSGSGKSWLSERLVPALNAIRVRSDVERKRLAGTQRTGAEQLGQGIYSSQFNDRTYAHLLDCAESCLRGGLTVIVDAAFLDATDRESFCKLATCQSLRYLVVCCSAPPAILTQRIVDRLREAGDPSDANLTVLEAQLRNAQPLAGLEPDRVVAVDTSDRSAIERVRAAYDRLVSARIAQ